MKVYSDIHEAYLGTLADVYDNPDHIASPRGQKTREKLNYQFTVLNPVAEPIVTKDLERNKVIERYTKKESELYNSGTNRVEDFAKASKFWNKIANPDGTINSAYGYLIWENKSHGSHFEQELVPVAEDRASGGKVCVYKPVMRSPWEWSLESLKADPDTRQAILRFSLPEHAYKGVKDFTCTMYGIFSIREGALNLTINMRSNDLMKGLVYDLEFFVSLMDKMLEDLKDTYPKLKKGTYTHIVHSLHIYERDEEAILKMIGRK